MVTLTYKDVTNSQFMEAFSKLAKFNGYKSLKTANNIGKIAKAIDEEFKIISDQSQEIAKTYGTKDENGKVVFDEKGQYTTPSDKLEEWKQVLKEFHETKIEISRDRIRLDELVGVPLSPVDLMVLEPFMYTIDKI